MPRKLFVKGQSGNPGGVPKNPKVPKKKARLKVQEILDMLNFKPFEEMVALYRDSSTKTRHKVEILTELCGYIAPKLKCVELSSDNENPFVINLNLQPGKKRVEFTQVSQDEITDDDDENN